MAQSLRIDGSAKPVRRVWIDKADSEEKRPLGIPVMVNRARQTLVKEALEPEWEARFEANSYGFRPGRSCHDAVAAIFTAIKQNAKYALDADIAKCFDRIEQKALLDKVNASPSVRRQIKAWLKAGVMDGEHRRHVKVQAKRSPYDGDWLYWSTRRGRSPEVSPRVAKLLQKQRGRCLECGLYFRDGELMDIDYVNPQARIGKEAYYNLLLVHRDCQKQREAEFTRLAGTYDKRQAFEEPYEG
jgi:5-methylcytosine-specific restriction endonuclease McrA